MLSYVKIEASTSVLFTYYFPIILWEVLGVGVEVWLWFFFFIIIFDRTVVPGSTKYVDTGTHLTLQNQDMPQGPTSVWKYVLRLKYIAQINASWHFREPSHNVWLHFLAPDYDYPVRGSIFEHIVFICHKSSKWGAWGELCETMVVVCMFFFLFFLSITIYKFSNCSLVFFFFFLNYFRILKVMYDYTTDSWFVAKLYQCPNMYWIRWCYSNKGRLNDLAFLQLFNKQEKLTLQHCQLRCLFLLDQHK